MNAYLVMIEIATLSKEMKTYYLLKCGTIKEAQAIIDKYLRDNGNTEREFDFSMTSVEKIDSTELPILEKYIEYYRSVV